MYCVRCGVKLTENIAACPLCKTPVWNPDEGIPERSFPDVYPERQRVSRRFFAILLTVICLIAVGALLLICFRIYGEVRWGDIASLGVALGFVVFVLPLWFQKPNPVIFIPVSHAAAAGYLLYLCLWTGGHWFLSLAFPLVALSAVINTAIAALLRYVKGGRLYILGSAAMASGAYTMFVELFLHITVGVEMFLWSPYSLGGCFLLGMLLFLIAMIRPLRETLDRQFFF